MKSQNGRNRKSSVVNKSKANVFQSQSIKDLPNDFPEDDVLDDEALCAVPLPDENRRAANGCIRVDSMTFENSATQDPWGGVSVPDRVSSCVDLVDGAESGNHHSMQARVRFDNQSTQSNTSQISMQIGGDASLRVVDVCNDALSGEDCRDSESEDVYANLFGFDEHLLDLTQTETRNFSNLAVLVADSDVENDEAT